MNQQQTQQTQQPFASTIGNLTNTLNDALAGTTAADGNTGDGSAMTSTIVYIDRQCRGSKVIYNLSPRCFCPSDMCNEGSPQQPDKVKNTIIGAYCDSHNSRLFNVDHLIYSGNEISLVPVAVSPVPSPQQKGAGVLLSVSPINAPLSYFRSHIDLHDQSCPEEYLRWLKLCVYAVTSINNRNNKPGMPAAVEWFLTWCRSFSAVDKELRQTRAADMVQMSFDSEYFKANTSNAFLLELANKYTALTTADGLHILNVPLLDLPLHDMLVVLTYLPYITINSYNENSTTDSASGRMPNVKIHNGIIYHGTGFFIPHGSRAVKAKKLYNSNITKEVRELMEGRLTVHAITPLIITRSTDNPTLTIWPKKDAYICDTKNTVLNQLLNQDREYSAC